jgi:Acyl-CoA carboxylase epsilon subunit
MSSALPGARVPEPVSEHASELDGAVSALRIVRGEPTDEELAVVTALVTAATSGASGSSGPAPRRGRWNDPAAAHRRPWRAGPGGWRATAD